MSSLQDTRLLEGCKVIPNRDRGRDEAMRQSVHRDSALVTQEIHDPIPSFRDQEIRLNLGIAGFNRGLLGEVATGVLHGILLVLTVQGSTHDPHYPMICGVTRPKVR
jgi:hypothetical protein